MKVLNKKANVCRGQKIGTTNIPTFDDQIDVTRLIGAEVALGANTLRRKLGLITGNHSIQVTTSNDRVILSGHANNAVEADRAASIAESFGRGRRQEAGSLINAITVTPSKKVILKVRFQTQTARVARVSDPGIPVVSSNPGVTGGASVIKSAGALLSSEGRSRLASSSPIW